MDACLCDPPAVGLWEAFSEYRSVNGGYAKAMLGRAVFSRAMRTLGLHQPGSAGRMRCRVGRYSPRSGDFGANCGRDGRSAGWSSASALQNRPAHRLAYTTGRNGCSLQPDPLANHALITPDPEQAYSVVPA